MEQVVDDPLMLGYRMANFQNINCIKQVKIHVGVKFFFGKMGVKARIEEKCENVKLAKEGKWLLVFWDYLIHNQFAIINVHTCRIYPCHAHDHFHRHNHGR